MARTSEVIYQCEYGEYVLPDGVDVEAYIAEHRERIHAELKQRARRIPGAYVQGDAKAVIYPLDDGSGAWAVEFCDPADDGVVELATFDGPRAERQAREYMRHEYGDNRHV